MQFPKEFLWGVSTSSYQIEGAAQEDERGETVWDRFTHTSGMIKDASTGDVACDHYHRYAEDVGLLNELGVDMYRFSVAWSRILPAGRGQINPKGLDFYNRLVDALLEAGIKPFATLYHWDLPQALQDFGGWNSRVTAEAFADYADILTRNLGDRVKLWSTHNEPWCTAFLGYDMGIFAPGVKDLKIALQATHHLLLSHGLAVPRMRANVGEGGIIGISPNFLPVYPASDKPEDIAATKRHDGYFNRWFNDPLFGKGYPQDMWEYYGANAPRVLAGDLEIIAQPLDYLGVNIYDPGFIAHDEDAPVPQTRHIPRPELERTADRQIYPDGVHDMLVRLNHDYAPPAFYVTENGAAFDDIPNADGAIDDQPRIRFLQAHFEAAARAMAEGVPLKGYCVWSLMDNFEWASGYTLRYGITYVDFGTLERTPKSSYHWYKDFIKAQREG